VESVLRVLDAHTGSYAEVRPSRSGLLRICGHVPGIAGAPDVTGLRVLLVADLLTRVAEMRNLQVLMVLADDGEHTGQLAGMEHAATALGIHAPAERASSAQAQTSLGGRIDVHLASYGAYGNDRLSGLVALVGPANLHRPGEVLGNPLAGQEDNPLAVRLALLSIPYHRPADLAEDVLTEARATIERWRFQVTEWAESPSRPVPKQIATTVQSVFGDLDTASAIALLNDVAADADLPAGAKFETFLSADRILGLDLPRDIGRVRR
jgi:hypothetical protein